MGGHATKWGVFAAHFWGAFTGRLDRSVLYQRVPRLLEAFGLARGEGRYARMFKSLARV